MSRVLRKNNFRPKLRLEKIFGSLRRSDPSTMNPLRLFSECALCFISLGFFIASLATPVKEGESVRSKTLLALLFIISILSGAAGYIRYVGNKNIARLCAGCRESVKEKYYGESDEENLEVDVESDENININLITQWSGIVKSFLQPSRTTLMLLHGPALSLFLFLVARLFAVTNFRTQPINLDFGPKYGRIESDGSYEENIAFGPRFSSFGHAVQGFLAALLSFPAVSGSIAHLIGRIGMRGRIDFERSRVILTITTLGYSLLTFYPTYNFFKRVVRDHPAFASTSYASNSMEWIMGYVLGLALGMLLTNITRWVLVVRYPTKYYGQLEAFMAKFDLSYVNETLQDRFVEEESVITPQAGSCRRLKMKYKPKYVFGKISEYTATSESKCCSRSCDSILSDIYHVEGFTIIAIFSKLALVVFTVSTLLSGILMGTTWNLCAESDGDNCVNSATNGIYVGEWLTLAFVLSGLAIELVFSFISIRL